MTTIEKARRFADRLFSFLVFLMAVAMFILSFSLPSQAALLPRWIALATAVLMLVVQFKPVRSKENTEEEVQIPFFIGSLYLVAYCIVFYLFGFRIATAILTIVLSRKLGLKNWVLTLLLALVLSVGLAYIFGHMFSVRIPEGALLKIF